MSQTAIFWPMIVHVALVLALYLTLGVRRRAAVIAGNAKVSQFRENRDEPAESLFVRNSLANQFELPPLFHVACLALFVTDGAGAWAIALAWGFVLSRIVHAFIHVTTNRIRYRQPAFSLGFVFVILLWAVLAIHIM